MITRCINANCQIRRWPHADTPYWTQATCVPGPNAVVRTGPQRVIITGCAAVGIARLKLDFNDEIKL